VFATLPDHTSWGPIGLLLATRKSRCAAFTAFRGRGVLPTPREVVLHGLEVLLHGCTGHSLSASRDVLGPGGVLTGAATLNYDGLNGCSRRAKQL
jgi:hypothetical protein